MYPQHSNPKRHNRTAHAPYNFVPLPDQVVAIEGEIAPQDRYEGRTGYIVGELTTLSPLYTRAALSPAFFAKWGETIGELTKDPDARRQYADFFHLDDAEKPVIPGSSLRGMVRALVEIAAYGKVRWVAHQPKVTFRAVAAQATDPLKEPYERLLGKNGKNVRAGYVVKKSNGDWYVRPARSPKPLGLKDAAYVKIKDSWIDDGAIPNLIRLTRGNYRPQYHDVTFSVGNGKAVQIRGKDKANGDRHSGILVCTGNMAETSGDASSTPRKTYALVLEEDKGSTVLSIPKQVVADYVDALTKFEKQHPPFDPHLGCLIEGRPIFYVAKGSEIQAFGHCPNFRVPALLADGKRAATPADFVPEKLVDPQDAEGRPVHDLVDAIFGYVAEGEDSDARAGRVFFRDAVCKAGQGNVWLRNEPLTPKVLATPKPTTFQHYLVQDRDRGHDPDNSRTLAHYSTPTPDQTVIRGHKLYWHKDESLGEGDFAETELVDWKNDTQYTQIKPVRAGIEFTFRIDFESLTDVELGVLLWVLDLPQGHHHRLGMGKPLGLGSVAIKPKLVLSDRQARYRKLLDESTWCMAESEIGNSSAYKAAFEQYILDHIGDAGKGAQRLADVPRIKQLLTMLAWPGPERAHTRYMTIEPNNEYKGRPVLPDPEGVARPRSGADAGPPKKARTAQRQQTQANRARPGEHPTPTAKPAEKPPTARREIARPTSPDEVKRGMLVEGAIVEVRAAYLDVDIGVGTGATLPLAELGIDISDLEEVNDVLLGGRVRATVKRVNKKGRAQLINAKLLPSGKSSGPVP